MNECEWNNADFSSRPQNGIGEIEIDCKINKARKLKIIIENASPLPEWHEGKGKDAWLFLDEVWVE